MPNRTSIAWTDYTSNPIVPKEGRWGCSKVSPGCDHCYAETLNKRYGNKRDFKGKWEFILVYKELEALLRLPVGSKVFLEDMGDVFHPDIPWEMLLKVFNFMAATDWITYQLLTKRPGRMAYFAEHIWPKRGGRWSPINPLSVRDRWPGTQWPPNVWAGTSVESQKYAPRLNCLERVPAPVRFVSAEPLLGPLDLRPWLHGNCEAWGGSDDGRVLHGVIVGGESGPHHRPMEVAWVQSIADHCQAANVPLFVKQGSSLYPGRQGQLPDRLWRMKEMPSV